MAACVLYRRAPGLRRLASFRRSPGGRAQHRPPGPEEDPDDPEEKGGASQRRHVSAQGSYRLHYNPSSYHGWKSALPGNRSDFEEEEEVRLAPSHWHQSNSYTVSCSRRLSSTKNTLLDFALGKAASAAAEAPAAEATLRLRRPAAPYVRVDSRAFQRCRPEYAAMSLAGARRPAPIEYSDAELALQRASGLASAATPSDVSALLAELGRLRPDQTAFLRSDRRFDALLRRSVERLPLFTPLQLLDALRALLWLGVPPEHAALEAYEAELAARAAELTLHQLLLAADSWRCIGKKVPRFLRRLYDAVEPRLGEVGLPETVQLLYVVGEGRKCPEDLLRPLEQLLLRHLPRLRPEELGAACLGLFKSQASLSEAAVSRVLDKAHSSASDLSDFALVNVLKYQRFSYLYHKRWLDAAATEVQRRADGMGVKGLMHVALTCSALHYYDDGVLGAVAERVPALVAHCRIKDTCKLLWAFGQLGFPPAQSPDLYPSLTEALRRKKAEFRRYPEHLLTALLGLAFVSRFPEDLVAAALSPEFVDAALKQTQWELKKDLFTLDKSVELELPGWSGPRLSGEVGEEVAATLWGFAESDVCRRPEVTEAEAALRELLGGERFVRKRMILPHTRSLDLEVRLSPGDGAPRPVVDPPSSPRRHPEAKKFSMGLAITDELLAQLVNGKKPATSPSSGVALRRLQPDEGERLFDSAKDLGAGIGGKDGRRHDDDEEDVVRIAVQVWNRNHYCTHSQRLLGLHAMKRRQLELAGFRVVELRPWEWAPLLRKSRTEKFAYLHCKLYDVLERSD